MEHSLYDAWEVDSDSKTPWRVQLINYVARFKSESDAQKYVVAVRRERKRMGLK